ncbi:MAG: hypothetical protein J6T72_01015 [Alphaproteobacteria bacterium]|nr:hypothetical protein [Alphaproteobacteria bacterium]
MATNNKKIPTNTEKAVEKAILRVAVPAIVFFGGDKAKGATTQPSAYPKTDNVELLYQRPQDNNTINADELYGRKVECNINELVSKRADWLCEEYVKSATRRLNAINRCANRDAYVKNMFARMGHGRKYDEYCLVAQLCAFKDVTDKTGNLQNVLPKSAECTSFIKALRKKGYGDCINNNPSFSNMRPGDMVFTPRGGGKYHATSVKKVWIDSKGVYHVLLTSFNRNHTYELKQSQTRIVVNMHKLANKALWKELEQQGLLTPEVKRGNVIQIIPMETYKEIKAYLTAGMENNNQNTADLPPKEQPEITFNIIQAAKSKDYS